MVRLLPLALSALLSGARAEEHPREHPAPRAPAPAKKPRSPEVLPGQRRVDGFGRFVEQAVRDYVRDQTEEEGSFTVEDGERGRSWETELLGVHADKVARLADGRVFVCADFKGEDGKNSQPLDIDFYLSGDEEGLTVEEILIHKVSGKPRYTYNEKNERVPVKEKKPVKPKAKPAQGAPGS